MLVHPEAAELPTLRGKLMLEARSLPFDTLLPHCSAIAHQGGIGTLFAAARAGTPQLVLPCMLDQYYWAERVRELGLGRSEKGPGALAEASFAKRLIDLSGDGAAREAAQAFSAMLSSREREAEMRSRIGELFAIK
jgi:UDP:flavonoid glycosyltransferase YjiC (YdhE family)